MNILNYFGHKINILKYKRKIYNFILKKYDENYNAKDVNYDISTGKIINILTYIQ